MEPFAQALFDAIKEFGIIEEKKLTAAFEESKKNNTSFQERLIGNDLISDVDLGKTVAELLHVPFIELLTTKIPSDLVYLIPETYARTHKVIAFQETDEEIKIAMVNPTVN